MNFQAIPDLATDRACLSCRRRAPASQLLLDLDDHDRLHAFYCVPCVTKGYAKKLASSRARRFKKSSASDWRSYGQDHLADAPPLQPDAPPLQPDDPPRT